MKSRILLVEDDPGMRRFTKMLLEQAGYRVRHTGTAEDALAITLTEGDIPDLLLSDIQLPGLSGIKLTEILREDKRTVSLPIILLTVLDKLPDKVRGLKTGADDYVTKPFEPSELLARAEALLRRSAAEGPSTVLEWESLRVDTAGREVTLRGKPVDLRRKEFELLVLFLRNKGKLLTRDHLCQTLWPDGTVVTDNTLTVHIKTLRNLMGPYGDCIQTLVGEGYRFEKTTK